MQISVIHTKMKEHSIQEENLQMLRRIQENSPVRNISKFEDGFKSHLRIKKLISRVGPGFNRLYKEKDQILPSVTPKLISVYLMFKVE